MKTTNPPIPTFPPSPNRAGNPATAASRRAARHARRAAALAGLVSAWVALGTAAADDAWKLPPEKTVLKPGAGRELVLGQCVACHSADYMTTQPPLDRTAWTASVEKMRSKYGAAIPTNVAPAIVDYLAAQYGPKAGPKADAR